VERDRPRGQEKKVSVGENMCRNMPRIFLLLGKSVNLQRKMLVLLDSRVGQSENPNTGPSENPLDFFSDF
jgi:hypothetical protein